MVILFLCCFLNDCFVFLFVLFKKANRTHARAVHRAGAASSSSMWANNYCVCKMFVVVYSLPHVPQYENTQSRWGIERKVSWSGRLCAKCRSSFSFSRGSHENILFFKGSSSRMILNQFENPSWCLEILELKWNITACPQFVQSFYFVSHVFFKVDMPNVSPIKGFGFLNVLL